MHRKITYMLMLVIVVVMLAPTGVFAVAGQPELFNLTIIHTNDFTIMNHMPWQEKQPLSNISEPKRKTYYCLMAATFQSGGHTTKSFMESWKWLFSMP